MPKPPTLPTLYDEVKTLDIAGLKDRGYLKPGSWHKGTIRWKRNGEETGSIGIRIHMRQCRGIMELDYLYQGEPVKYTVLLVSLPSNLGKGIIWFFQCPSTGKRCRKLYGAGKYFLHREAFKGCFYTCQTYSKKNRELIKVMKAAFPEPGPVKRRQRFYNGKPTKRYLKQQARERKAFAILAEKDGEGFFLQE